MTRIVCNTPIQPPNANGIAPSERDQVDRTGCSAVIMGTANSAEHGLTEGPTVHLIFNPRAGAGALPRLEDLIRMLEKRGLHVQPLLLDGGADLAEAAHLVLSQGARTLVVAGGDGTVSAIASAIVDSDITLGIIPTGTLNHFAKDLQIPLDLEQAVAVLAAGRTTQIDVGEVNGRAFINNSSLGIYPRIVSWREQQQAIGRNKWIALFWATLAALRRMPFLRVRLSANDTEIVRQTPLVFIGNNEYEIDGFKTGARQSLTSGRLFIYVANAQSGMDLVRLTLSAVNGRLRQAREFDALSAREAWIETRRAQVRVAFDGEVAWMQTPLHYRARPAALRVLVP